MDVLGCFNSHTVLWASASGAHKHVRFKLMPYNKHGTYSIHTYTPTSYKLRVQGCRCRDAGIKSRSTARHTASNFNRHHIAVLANSTGISYSPAAGGMCHPRRLAGRACAAHSIHCVIMTPPSHLHWPTRCTCLACLPPGQPEMGSPSAAHGCTCPAPGPSA